jgi:bleomycin hydrolase
MTQSAEKRGKKRDRYDIVKDESKDAKKNEFALSTVVLKKLKQKFYENADNRLAQNMLCANSLWDVSEDRNYMQSRDSHFSYVLDPKLIVSNQGLTGRCWLFAVLNVMRHELIRALQLPFDFELSESYLSFYEKLEKCNYTLSQFMKCNHLDFNDNRTQILLSFGCDDGGTWVTCANLIKKYGIIPKACFKESRHSSNTVELNDILGYKVREFVLELTREQNFKKRKIMKDVMMEEIYCFLAKMVGTPPNINEKVEWTFVLRSDTSDELDKEQKRNENNGKFTPIQRKVKLDITPHNFYKNIIMHKLDEYYKFSNDPRNEYNEYYESFNNDMVIEGEKNGYYNLQMDDMIQMCLLSIKNNCPVQVDIDVNKYLHDEEFLFDPKCFDRNTVLKSNFDALSKADRLNLMESSANHAIVIVGMDTIIIDKKEKIIKVKIENSWGRIYSDAISESDAGYYTASIEWFNEYAYNFVIHKDYVSERLQHKYKSKKENPTILHENDAMA